MRRDRSLYQNRNPVSPRNRVSRPTAAIAPTIIRRDRSLYHNRNPVSRPTGAIATAMRSTIALTTKSR
ncbi:hypothetical protein [Argonema antarcticum]|uniref:hypothetical protein n=1 Tax=Argonema antarcticum TaxID=2942763 RepID=UPI002011D87E|nr:hypothetical protein [Argonema antarcticum]MCL1473307.1 hypothetical protein [Argonema antarcticum A004/B2]